MDNKICRNCGTENQADYIFCKRCGRPIEGDNGSRFSQDGSANQGNNPNQGQPFGGYGPNQSYDPNQGQPFDGYGPNQSYGPNQQYGRPFGGYGGYGQPFGQNPYQLRAETIDGVNTEDVELFLGKSAQKYIPVFSKMELTGTKTAVNLLVLIFSVLISPIFAACWFLHKRMNKLGIAIFLICAITEFAYLYTAFSAASALISAEIAAGADIAVIMNKLSVLISQAVSSNSVALAMNGLYSFVSLTVGVISGIFANRLYKNFVIEKIKSVSAKSEEDYRSQLVRRGGTRNALWVILLILYIGAMFALSVFFFMPIMI